MYLNVKGNLFFNNYNYFEDAGQYLGYKNCT